jgi:thiamine-monophosphate kinase
VAEADLIRAIEEVLEARGDRLVHWVGDDAAVVRARALAVTSIDTIVEGVHFQLSTHSLADIGWKALGQALSDIAAMGAETGEAYVSLVLPESLLGERALELVAGLEELANQTGTTIAGGDVVAAPGLTITAAVTGWADSEEQLVGRDGAREGDLVGVTGTLGAAGAGLLLLRQGAVEVPARDALIRRHRRPVPLLEAGRALAAAGASAMIDVSDGIATDAAHLAHRSGTGLRVRLADLPLATGVRELAAATGQDAAVFAATAGDDYELLFTLPPRRRDAAEAAARAAGVELTWIGEAAGARGATFVTPDGRAVEGIAGFEHC